MLPKFRMLYFSSINPVKSNTTKYSFFHRVALIWNSLPEHIILVHNSGQFTKLLLNSYVFPFLRGKDLK